MNIAALWPFFRPLLGPRESSGPFVDVYLVDVDGEILETIWSGASPVWHVEETGQKFMSLADAKRAVRKRLQHTAGTWSDGQEG